jgi:hypothetical protein
VIIVIVTLDCMMKDEGIGYQTADSLNGAIHKVGEHNFSWLELATRNYNNYSSLGCKNWNLIQISSWRKKCSFAHKKNQKII